MKRCLPLAVVAAVGGVRLSLAQEITDLPSPYPYPQAAWSPYLVGALIGVLALLTMLVSGKKVGASSAYADMAGVVGRFVAPRHIASLQYFREHQPAIGWALLFLTATIVGAFLAAWTDGELSGRYLQDLWVARFGPDSHLLRTLIALVGGVVMAYGARLAGGCTSGHGISGTLQLAVSSWIAVICFFIGGIATALLVYRL
jgi:uncharacterized protein